MNRLLTTIVASALLVMAGLGSTFASETPKKVSDTSMKRIQEIHAYFAVPENKVKIQFPGTETHYAWQHMSRFYPTAQILREGSVSELPEQLDPTIGKITFEKGGKVETVNEHLDNYPVDAFLVVRGGKIVFERYNTMRPIDKHAWFSSGKVIGSTMLALLEAEGKVDVKQPVSYYLPQLKGSAWDTVTVEETLDMATGLDATEHDEPNHDSRTNPEQGWYRWAATIGVLPDALNLKQTPYDVLRSMKRRKPGHTLFEYNSINTFVVGRIVEEITGKPLSEVFADRVWRKIGAQADAHVAVSPEEGLPLHFGFTSSTLRDKARFGMIFTPSWNKVSSEKIIPDNVLKMIQTSGRPEIFSGNYLGDKMSNSFSGEKGLTNRYQWDAILTDGDMYKAGVGGQGLYVSPARDMVIVWFCSGDGKDQEETMARAIAKSFKKKSD